MLLAHCPLCAAGTGIVALGASYFGIDDAIVGIWVGAFSLSLGIVTAKAIKKKIIPLQDFFVAIIVYLLTVLPSAVFFKHYLPLYIHLFGPYGSALNTMYIVKRFYIGALLGALIIVVSPYLNNLIISLFKEKKIAFQKLILTFVLLFIISLIFHFYL